MTTDDDRLARDLASEACRPLLALRAGGGEPGALRQAGDRTSHEFLAAQLAALRPGDAVLSEEGRDDPARLSADRVWIVDPLDGTREFGEPGRTDWAVHVALWERGKLTAGAVALPAQGTVLSTAEPPAPPPPAEPGRPVRVLVSRTRPPALLDRLAKEVELGAGAARIGRRQGGRRHQRDRRCLRAQRRPVRVGFGRAGRGRGRRGASRVAAGRLRPGVQPGGPFPSGYPYLLSGARCHAAGWFARRWLFCCAVALQRGRVPCCPSVTDDPESV